MNLATPCYRSIAVLLVVLLSPLPAFSQDEPAAPAEGEGETASAPAPPPLSESLSPEAKSEYEAGKLLYVDGDYAGALIKFEAAFDSSGDPRLLWNMAASEKNLRHYARALRLLERYEEEGAGKLTQGDLEDAQRLRRAMQPFVGKVMVTVNEPGAKIFVDDEQVGTSPLSEPLLVDIGTHVIRVSKPGFVDFTQKQSVSGSREVNIEAKLEVQKTEGTLIINAGTNDEIRIDGKAVGTGSYTGSLPAGKHQVLVRREGYVDYHSGVVIEVGEREQLAVRLEPLGDDSGLPAWVWITGGVVVAGLGTGAFFLLRPEDETAQPVEGTIPPGTVQLPFGY